MIPGYSRRLMRRPRQVCIRCGYVGDRHLCHCMTTLSEALDSSDLYAARTEMAKIVANAVAADEARVVWG